MKWGAGCGGPANLLLAAKLRAHFGLPGLRHDDILPFRDKCLMKEMVMAAGIRVPAFGRFDVEAARANKAGYFARISTEVGLPDSLAGGRQLRRWRLQE
jgi:hypothetical protein